MSKQQKWIEAIKSLPTAVSTAIGLVTAIISFVILLQGNYYLGVTILGTVLSIGTLFMFAYLAFAKTPPLIEGGKGRYRYEGVRPWAFVGIGFVAVMVVVALALKPSRSFIVSAFIPTATASPSATSTPPPSITPTPSPSTTSTPSPLPTPSPSATPTPSPSATPTPSPTSTPGLGVTVGDVKWRGPMNHCSVIVNGETVSFMPVANPRNLSDRYEPRDFYYPGDALVSFDLLANQETKISDILVEVVDYQPVPTIQACPPTPSPLGEAHMFVAPVDAPGIAGKSRFPAYLVTETGTPGYVWLSPDNPTSFFVFIAAKTPGLYTFRCCDIELSRLETQKLVQIDSIRQILVMYYR